MSSIRGIVVVAAVAVVALLSLAPASAQYAPGGGIVCDTSVVLPGGAFTFSAGGFLPGSAVAVTATGSTTGLVGRSTTAAGQWTHESTTTADGAGDAVGVVQVPDDATGPTSVVLSGTGLDDGPRVLTNASAVTVAAAGDPLVEPAVDADHADPASATDAVAAPDGSDLPATGTGLTTPLLVVAGTVIVAGVVLLSVARRRAGGHTDR